MDMRTEQLGDHRGREIFGENMESGVATDPDRDIEVGHRHPAGRAWRAVPGTVGLGNKNGEPVFLAKGWVMAVATSSSTKVATVGGS